MSSGILATSINLTTRNPRALRSALAALGTLQIRALGFLNTVDPLDTVSNCYLADGSLSQPQWLVLVSI